MSPLPDRVRTVTAAVRTAGTRAVSEVRLASADPVARADLGRRVRTRAGKEATHLRQRVKPVRPSVTVPTYDIPNGPISRPELRVAVILDPFSTLAFGFEWTQMLVPRQGWERALAEFKPQMLFVESAWAGNDRAWRLTMTQPQGPHPNLVALIQWCREQGIPAVFWNKEDPPNYDVFIHTAALFDQVFTVDADRIDDYRRDLGHDRVALLPFAAQPRIHSPRRATAAPLGQVAFAGTYFVHKHPGRRQQMDLLLPAAQQRGLHIFSRMSGEDKRYHFPAPYRHSVVGSVPYEQMLSAATAYRVFLNVNSVTDSPTMCARRLFELSAAQTTVLSAPSAAIEHFFGDTITVVQTTEQATEALTILLDQPEYRQRLALRAHRRVFDRHLYTHRVDDILRTVGLPVTPVDHSISAVVPTMRPDQIEHVLTTIAHQAHPDLEIVLVLHGLDLDEGHIRERARNLGIDKIEVIFADRGLTLGACMNLGVAASSGRYVAKMDDDNTYGPNYLSDLVQAFAYSEAAVVGKRTHYVHLESSNATIVRFENQEHRYVRMVQGGTLLFSRELAESIPFEDLPRRVDTTFLDNVQKGDGLIYSTDRFNFISRRGADVSAHTWGISDAQLLATQSRLVFFGDAVAHAVI